MEHDAKEPTTASTVARQKTKTRWLKPVIQLSILALVAWGIGRTIFEARDKFADAGFSPGQLSPGWIALAAFFYALGMVPSCVYWKNTLAAMGQHPSWPATIRAFYIGHLGKYVPGKALVVVLRTGLIRGPRVNTTIAATSVFVETLTMMGVGATVAAVLLGLLFREHQTLLWLAIFLAACAGVPTWPPLFRRIVGWLQLRRATPEIEEAVAGLDYRLMAIGWITITIGWFLLGLSLYSVIQSLPNTGINDFLSHWPLLTACVALAMVAGFLSLLPGGVGVREFVVMTLLAPVYGEVTAIVSAIVLRAVWLGTEVVIAGILYPLSNRSTGD